MNERVFLGIAPVIGFGEQLSVPTMSAAGHWGMALTSSMLGAVTTWALDGIARKSFRGRR